MKIVISGNYGAGNIGDEMILSGMLQMIRNISPFAEITVLSGNPRKTEEGSFVKSEKKFPSGFRSFAKAFVDIDNKTRKAVKECDYFFLGGGGLFGGPEKRANIIWGIQVLMAKMYRRPIIHYGQSIGPARTKVEKIIIKKAYKNAKLITVRDSKSKSRLKKMGVKGKIYVIPDMVFRWEDKQKLRRKENQLVVALRAKGDLPEYFKNNVASFINDLISKRKWEVKFIDFQSGENADEELSESIIKKIKDKTHVEHIFKITKEDACKIIGESTVTLGMRLHSILTSAKENTPFIAINYAPKIEDSLEEIGMGDYKVNPYEMDEGNLMRVFTKVLNKKSLIGKELDSYVQKTSKEHQEMEKVLKKLINTQ